MDPRIETVTKGWRFRSCEPGYAGLNALAEARFSGSVAAEEATGFMVNGRLVGIAGGTIESFWSSDIAALEADEPAEALLSAMLIAEDNVEAEYYTGETAISSVHETLASGGFSGYLELSENVFSGDYFVIYYGGTTKSVAMLGTEDRVISGDEAFERACDEVGIYEVKSVGLDVVEIPEPEVDDSASEEAAAEEETVDEATETSTPEPVETEPVEEDSEPTEAASPTEPAVSQRETPSRETGSTKPPTMAATGEQDLATLAEAARGASAASVAPSDQVQASDSEEWVTIPSLDPSNTTMVEPDEPDPEPEPEAVTEPSGERHTASETEESTEPETPSAEVNELAAELDAAERENDRLRRRVEELEERLEELSGDPADTELPAAEAIGGTNLFVRYQTKGRNTLEDAVAGSADQNAVGENLRLERHTRFEVEGISVNGEPFDEFLESSLQYRFVSWVLSDLLFELHDAGELKAFDGLIEVIPEVDRVEFAGTIPVHTQEGGDRRSEQFDFDVVFRDSMGAALLAANVHDRREPVNDEPVSELLASANAVAGARPSLDGAMFVARSYFEPEAMETVADATSGGLLRGSSRKSYVSVSRKNGFYLCLVEARDSTFHLNVPD